MEKESQILRFTTAGSVDDGKSTLIGRLLLDSKSLYKDQLESIENSSKKMGFDYVDLSLLTDGLKSEREQGITIDVAYRYFSTPKRKFIIADSPGHVQYTRNMITGASTANLAIILIDARKGLKMFEKVEVPVLGVIENMSTFICPKCGTVESIFGEGGGEQLAEENDVKLLGQLPLLKSIRVEMDKGTPTVSENPESPVSLMYRDIARKMAATLSMRKKDYSSAFPKIVIQND